MNAPQDFRAMTAASIGKDLLQALLQEMNLLPAPWPKLTKAKQDDVIERLRARVETNVKMAVHLLAAEGRTVVVADLESVTRKDGIKAVFKINSTSEGRHELFDSEGQACLIVIADAESHIAGMDEIKGEEDQRGLDLGHEYHDNDGDGMDSSGNVVDGEVLGLPSPSQVKPSDAELERAWDDGYQAAEDGKPQSDCPIIRSELVVQWIRGWKGWHDEQEKAA